jgi:NADH-quinone oxidoreductase subunit C
MDAPAIAAVLQERLPGVEHEIGAAADQPTIFVAASGLLDTCRTLRDDPALAFAFLSDVTGVDWWPAEPRFEVVYHLVSFAHETRLRLKVRLPGDGAALPTLSGVWPAANWLEREVWDMFGIGFDGHPDLRRLLMPEDWEGHPLRKDYPVQVRQPVKIFEPLQISEEEFARTLQEDREARGAASKADVAGRLEE